MTAIITRTDGRNIGLWDTNNGDSKIRLASLLANFVSLDKGVGDVELWYLDDFFPGQTKAADPVRLDVAYRQLMLDDFDSRYVLEVDLVDELTQGQPIIGSLRWLVEN